MFPVVLKRWNVEVGSFQGLKERAFYEVWNLMRKQKRRISCIMNQHSKLVNCWTDNSILANDLTVRNSSCPIVARVYIQYLRSISSLCFAKIGSKLISVFTKKSKLSSRDWQKNRDLYTWRSNDILCNWVRKWKQTSERRIVNVACDARHLVLKPLVSMSLHIPISLTTCFLRKLFSIQFSCEIKLERFD